MLMLAFAASGCSSSASKQSVQESGKKSEPALSESERRINVESFENVWQVVNDTHWDQEFGGVDWAEVRKTHKSLVAAASTQAEARKFIRQALGELGESHFYVIPAELYDDMTGGPRGRGDCGLRLRVIDGRAVVVKVIPGSSAEEAGIQPGWEVLASRDNQLRPFIEELSIEYADSRTITSKLSIAVRGKLRGEVGDELPLRLIDGEEKEYELKLRLTEPSGHKAVFSNLPPAWVDITAKRLEGDLGYISLNTFLDPTFTMGEFNKAMTQFHDCSGVVLDLRGNGGGIAGMAPGIAGWFMKEKGQRLGKMITRDSHVNLIVRPRSKGYYGPLAILIDGLSASTSEFLAAGLQDLGRALVFGSRSAGAALVANMIRLPNGDGFEYAFADYESTGGSRIEGNGITPDVEIVYVRTSLLAGEDAALTAAIDWINESH
ncbi:MAG: hypothetical protein KOO63_14290 [Bacteroidales bacterium]|nr:hypothetical protein [Candidatus Latescibacterota bacterium]